jgi:predicted nucleic acid-binding protein
MKGSPGDLTDFIDTMGMRAELLRVDASMLVLAGTAALRDSNGLPVLALLIGSNADHLVTGDKDLLALSGTHPILRPASFVGRFVR